MDAAQTVASPELPPAPEAAPGVIGNAAALWDDLRELAHDHLELAMLESQRAGESLVSIVVFGIVIAVLVVTAWMGLVAALVLWLVHLDLAPSLAILIGVVVNLAGAGGLLLAIRQRSHYLTFPSTVRALKHRDPDATVAQKSPEN